MKFSEHLTTCQALTMLWISRYHFADEESEAQSGHVACTRSSSQEMGVASCKRLAPVPVPISPFRGTWEQGGQSVPLGVIREDLRWQTGGDTFILIIMEVYHAIPQRVASSSAL